MAYPVCRTWTATNDPEANARAWEGGWFHTGDVMRMGRDGSLNFVERKKNIIRRSGENIAAIEVEGALASHPQVAQVAVVAAPDPIRDEEVLAVVTLKSAVPDEAAMSRELLSHAAGELAYYKVPAYVLFVDSLPTTSTGKLQKAALKEIAADLSGQPPAYDLRGHKQGLRKTLAR
ncbi:AMP-binding protein [Paracoccus sp. S-4012]|uniref:AMP-binding enzyme n=1 Tax=Paracoccus sp. S-4012 TaxID=2665648 RepID=UPI0012AF25F6|nr:AMP-binding protein [Paracoccus sp. S-4012]MRX51616.1 AMP-binding protein [Paracoccus sp. S-4012]